MRTNQRRQKGEMEMLKGLKSDVYLIDELFFELIKEPAFQDDYVNKGRRPFYVVFTDDLEDVFWVIPLCSRVEKYREIIRERESAGKRCDILHIAEMSNHRESVFMIQNMFPITKKHLDKAVKCEYKPLILVSERDRLAVEEKARHVKECVKKGIIMSVCQPDVNAIYEKLPVIDGKIDLTLRSEDARFCLDGEIFRFPDPSISLYDLQVIEDEGFFRNPDGTFGTSHKIPVHQRMAQDLLSQSCHVMLLKDGWHKQIDPEKEYPFEYTLKGDIFMIPARDIQTVLQKEAA